MEKLLSAGQQQQPWQQLSWMFPFSASFFIREIKELWKTGRETRLVNVNLPFQSPFSSKPVCCKQKIAQKAQHVRNTSKITIRYETFTQDSLLKKSWIQACSMWVNLTKPIKRAESKRSTLNEDRAASLIEKSSASFSKNHNCCREIKTKGEKRNIFNTFSKVKFFVIAWRT